MMKEMRAEVAVCSKWSNEVGVWPAKKRVCFEYGIKKEESMSRRKMSDAERKGE